MAGNQQGLPAARWPDGQREAPLPGRGPGCCYGDPEDCGQVGCPRPDSPQAGRSGGHCGGCTS